MARPESGPRRPPTSWFESGGRPRAAPTRTLAKACDEIRPSVEAEATPCGCGSRRGPSPRRLVSWPEDCARGSDLGTHRGTHVTWKDRHQPVQLRLSLQFNDQSTRCSLRAPHHSVGCGSAKNLGARQRRARPSPRRKVRRYGLTTPPRRCPAVRSSRVHDMRLSAACDLSPPPPRQPSGIDFTSPRSRSTSLQRPRHWHRQSQSACTLLARRCQSALRTCTGEGDQLEHGRSLGIQRNCAPTCLGVAW